VARAKLILWTRLIPTHLHLCLCCSRCRCRKAAPGYILTRSTTQLWKYARERAWVFFPFSLCSAEVWGGEGFTRRIIKLSPRVRSPSPRCAGCRTELATLQMAVGRGFSAEGSHLLLINPLPSPAFQRQPFPLN